MNYNIEMQFAGLCLVIAVSISYLFSKKGHTLQYKIFPYHLIVEFLLLILDIASTVVIAERDRFPLLTEITGRGYIIVLNFWVGLTIIYGVSCTISENSSKRKKIFFSYLSKSLLAVCFILGIYTLFGDLRYAGSERHIYSYHGPSDACYLFSAICVSFIIPFMIISRREITLQEAIPVWCFVGVQGGAGIIQKFQPELLLIGFGSALCEYIIFRTLEHSREYEEQENIIKSFAETIESRDEETGRHIIRTTAYVKIILEELKKTKKYKKILTKEHIDVISEAAALHDVGKLAISDSILLKKGKLTKEEIEILNTHPQKGASIIQQSFQKIGSRLFIQTATEMAMSHHERWNGKGYPQGLKENEIPLAAQIMAIADTYDAITQKRQYRNASSSSTAFSIIEHGKGEQFSPEITDAFLKSRHNIEKTLQEYSETKEFKGEKFK